MTNFIRACIAIGSVLLLGCRGFDPHPPKEAGAPAAERPLVERTAPPASIHTHGTPIRVTDQVLSFYIPEHIDRGRHIHGTSIDIVVEPARWWTQNVGADTRGEPETTGPMLARHRTRSSRSFWNSMRRGAFVPWTTGTSLPSRGR